MKIESEGNTLEYSPDGKCLGLGSKNGQIMILNPNTMKTIRNRKDRSDPITVF